MNAIEQAIGVTTRVVVLEPDGKHWSMDMSLDSLGKPFCRAEPSDWTERVFGNQLPNYQKVDYAGHEFSDGAGNRYWVYARVR